MSASLAPVRASLLPILNPYTLIGTVIFLLLGLVVSLNLLEGKGGIYHLYLLMLIQLVPAMVAFTRGHFTYISFIMISHFTTFSLSKYMQFQDVAGLPKIFPEVILAIREQTFCTVLTIIIYYGCRILLFQGRAENEVYQKIVLQKWQLLLLGAYVVFVPMFLKHLPAWFLSVHFLFLSADVLLLFTSTCVGNQVLMNFFKFSAAVTACSYFLKTGMLTLVGSFATFSFLVACLEKKYIKVVYIIFLVVFASAVQSVKGTYRSIISENTQLSTMERIGALADLLSMKYWYDDSEIIHDMEERNAEMDRSGMLLSGFARVGDDSLERVLANTPAKVPFWNGESYASIPFMFIPRALWKDKPTRHFWNKYGRMYGVLSDDDLQTSVGVSYLAEAYMNFGFGAMYLLAVFMGFLFAFVEKLSSWIVGGHFFFTFLVFLTPLLNSATDLGSALNSLCALVYACVLFRPTLLKLAQRDAYS